MRAFTARLAVLVCALIGLAAGAVIAEGYLWLAYGAIAAATIGARVATAHVPQDKLIFGAMFATLGFGSVSRYERLTDGITVRYLAATVLAAAVIRAFVSLSSPLNSSGSGRHHTS